MSCRNWWGKHTIKTLLRAGWVRGLTALVVVGLAAWVRWSKQPEESRRLRLTLPPKQSAGSGIFWPVKESF